MRVGDLEVDEFERLLRRSVREEIDAVARLSTHDQSVASAGERKERRDCRDDETKSHGSSDRSGSKTEGTFASPQLTRKQMEDEADALIDSFAASRKRTPGGK